MLLNLGVGFSVHHRHLAKLAVNRYHPKRDQDLGIFTRPIYIYQQILSLRMRYIVEKMTTGKWLVGLFLIKLQN